jgi:hypothetical protein
VSLYFKKHRYEYYELLNRVGTHGDWESWMDYFLKAKKTVGEDIHSATSLYMPYPALLYKPFQKTSYTGLGEVKNRFLFHGRL